MAALEGLPNRSVGDVVTANGPACRGPHRPHPRGRTNMTTTRHGSDLARVSLVSPELSADPFPYFRELLDHEPVLWSERHKAWLISRYDDVSAALRHKAIGSDRVGPSLA